MNSGIHQLTSIIVPTFNQHELLSRLVTSLAHSLSASNCLAELIIVDNRSDDPQALAYLEALSGANSDSAFESIKIIKYPYPFNYSAINNHAASLARGENLCFLNNDVEVINNSWLTELLSHLDDPTTGCVGAKLYYPDDTIQHAGVVLGIEKVAGHIYKHAPRTFSGHNGYLKQVQEVTAVTGACMVLKRSVFEKVHGFDEHLPVAFNDVDLCLRVRHAGYRIIWTPAAELYHHESKSRGTRGRRTNDQLQQHKLELKYMHRKWGRLLKNDPCQPGPLHVAANEINSPDSVPGDRTTTFSTRITARFRQKLGRRLSKHCSTFK
ncbi:MAG: glycosyltransferase family 2 protein [Granulosicoccus sp.]